PSVPFTVTTRSPRSSARATPEVTLTNSARTIRQNAVRSPRMGRGFNVRTRSGAYAPVDLVSVLNHESVCTAYRFRRMSHPGDTKPRNHEKYLLKESFVVPCFRAHGCATRRGSDMPETHSEEAAAHLNALRPGCGLQLYRAAISNN